jgi:hypothetical protein
VDFHTTLQGTLQVKTDQSLKNQAAQSVGTKNERSNFPFAFKNRLVKQ